MPLRDNAPGRHLHSRAPVTRVGTRTAMPPPVPAKRPTHTHMPDSARPDREADRAFCSCTLKVNTA
eukprot:2599089-Prymnesium_polylepis.1